MVRVFRQNEARTLGQPGGLKNGPIWLKFGTLLPWVNIFLNNVKFGACDEFFTTPTIGPPNSWKNTEVEPSALGAFDYDNKAKLINLLDKGFCFIMTQI